MKGEKTSDHPQTNANLSANQSLRAGLRSELIAVQEGIRNKIELEDRINRDQISVIAGVDQAFTSNNEILSGIVLLDYDTMEPIERKYTAQKVDFPYIPGFLAFREGPAVISAYRELENEPDLLMVDGCGINHPRGAGRSEQFLNQKKAAIRS